MTHEEFVQLLKQNILDGIAKVEYAKKDLRIAIDELRLAEKGCLHPVDLGY
jgi:hypothetical protein